MLNFYCGKSVSDLMASLHNRGGNPSTPGAVRKIAIDFLSPTAPRETSESIESIMSMLGKQSKNHEGIRPSWPLLQAAADTLRRKDGVEFIIGEFLHLSISESKKARSRAALRDAWLIPNTCQICYRLSGERKFCSNHDRLYSEAGYRKGRRRVRIYQMQYQLIRQGRKQMPEEFSDSEFNEWIKSFAPNVYSQVGNAKPAEVLAYLDDKSRNETIANYRANEHNRMISRLSLLREKKVPWTIETFLLRAEAWLRAEKDLKHGGPRSNSGGARIGAGRPRKKAA